MLLELRAAQAVRSSTTIATTGARVLREWSVALLLLRSARVRVTVRPRRARVRLVLVALE